ncbi:protein croquemort-like [Pollicipes pollicipes]|uniref:protein croquemort-like n=1 Tax=Pollicipes pollicipes TaxID=41117 RepID=UPI001884CBC3|nr:protein croquemort-like [Pollicipes pollicipes]
MPLPEEKRPGESAELAYRISCCLSGPQLALRSPGSEGYPYWLSTSFPVFIRFYFWNVTNWEDVLSKQARPILQEMGPYTYREEHQKVNITWNSNDTVTYMQIKTWFFEPDMSNGTVEDRVTTLNVPLLAAADSVKDMGRLVKYMFNLMVNRVGSQAFVTKTVREFLFEGYNDPLLDAAVAMEQFLHIAVPFDKFGWFYARNTTPYYDGVVNMDTGSDVSRMGNIYSWNYSDTSSAFAGSCNMLNGSAGELFPARLHKDFIQFFSTDLCRTLKVPYQKEASVYDLTANRYAATEMLFGSPEVNPDNWCNCHGECPPSGLLDQSHCRQSMQAFVSLPHMLFADPEAINETEGQRPEADVHNFHIDIEPTTGTSVSVRARFQINLLLKSNPDIKVLNHLPRAHMPMFWFENAVDTTPELAAQFITITGTIPLALQVGSWVITALGGLVLAGGAALCMHRV